LSIPSKEELTVEANKDPTVDPHRVSVLYGDHGKRKTSTAVAMVKEKGLLLSSDDSWKVLLNERHRDIRDRVEIKSLTGISQLDYTNMSEYDTIIWDTVSQSVETFLDLLYDEGTWKGKEGKPAFRDQIESKNPELKGLEILSPMDYRVVRDKLRPAFNKLFKETDAHIIFTSQMTEPFPGVGNQKIRPSIPAATFKVIGTRADLIGYISPASGSKFSIDFSENSLSVLGKSRIEGIQGKMNLDDFVKTYKEIVFT
jgi:AAA domain